MTIRQGSRLFLILSITLWLPISGLPIASADNTQNLGEIQALAEQFALSHVDSKGLTQIEAKATAMDPRLQLARCDIPIEAFTNSNTISVARTTVGVRCSGAKPWTLYVPVNISALAPAVFTKRPLLRGEPLDTQALELRRIPLPELPFNHVGSIQQLGDMEAARPLKAGVALTLNAVKPRRVVKRGQEVVIQANSSTIQVKMMGVAMKDGNQGELIPVRNTNSGRTIQARVLNSTTVAVNM